MGIRMAAVWLGVIGLCAACTRAPGQQIAFTWDDLPAHSALPPGETRVEIGRKLVKAMKDAGLPPVYGFVNGIHVQEEPLSEPMLKEWRDAGFLLGNHAWSHMNLNQNTAAAWEADVLKNEPTIQKYAGNTDWHWLRFPYLAQGDTPEKRAEVRKFLADHGYKIAGVTTSFADYLYNEPYARCAARNDDAAIAQLEKSYLDAADKNIDATRAMARTLYGHDIPYVLLMHVGALDARVMPQLIALYRQKGFTFISLQDAEKDPFYKTDLDPSLPSGIDSLEGAMQARGLPRPASIAPTVDLNAICR